MRQKIIRNYFLVALPKLEEPCFTLIQFLCLPSYQLAGLISISSRFLPTVLNLLRQLAEEAQGHQTPEPPRQQSSLAFQSVRNQSQPNPTSSIPESSVSSNISVFEGGIEYSSPNLSQRSTKTQEAELSL